MAVLLRVLVLGAIAAAAHESIIWWPAGRTWLGCTVPGRGRWRPRRPLPLLDDDQTRPRVYVWRKDDVEINPKRVSSNGSLEVTRRRDGEGTYQCGIHGQRGLVLGYPVQLKFPTMEKEFSLVPENQTVSVGQPVTLNCRIGSEPDPQITWYKDHRALSRSDRYYELKDQLLIIDVKREDAGAYYCTAINSLMNKTRTSPEGWLTVTEEQEVRAPTFLLTAPEVNISRPQGSYVVLPCPVQGWPRRELLWELRSPELDNRTAELEFTEEVLVLRNLQPDQAGLYACSLQAEGGIVLKRVFNVEVSSPPNITIPPLPKEAPRASTIRFNCTAAGNPPPAITWFKDGQPLVLGGSMNFRKSTDDQRYELVISGVTSKHAGVYQCFARNPSGVASAWATLNVSAAEAAAPPGAVWCRPEGPRAVRVTWTPPSADKVIAYTVHATPQEANTTGPPNLPHNNTEELVTVNNTLTPYRFQVRAYMQTTSGNKNVASDMSQDVVCQGQGVPIQLSRLNDDSVLVSWKQFALQTPGVAQWMLQYRDDDEQTHNVTLDGAVTNYTLTAPSSSLMAVRMLGTRSLPWLPQDLTSLPWTSTSTAGDQLDDGEVTITPYDVEVSEVSARGFTVQWRVEGGGGEEGGGFLVCARRVDDDLDGDKCIESPKTSVTFDNLESGCEYEVRVEAVRGRRAGGAAALPYTVRTHYQGPEPFKNLSGQFVNSSAIRVSWGGAPGSYTVNYSAQLRLPVEQWDAVQTNGNTVLITGIDPIENTFVMVTDNESHGHSKIETIPPLYKDPETMELHYEYTSGGLRVWWGGAGRWAVRAAQNITRPVETWPLYHVTEPSVQLTDLDPSLPVYVMVTVSERSTKNQVLTIEPRPLEASLSWHYLIGIVVGLIALGLLTVGAVCIWRRRKQGRSPLRSRRRNMAANDGNEEEGSDLKSVGGRLANGGSSKDAGEPLLNGHVHITENPTLKTPNGKVRKGMRYENTFDVSRYEDPDATLETVLEADSSASTAYNLLDTSRRPDFDLSRSSRELSTNNSFNKLPDDNMNSELTRSSFDLDNSKIQPTLQPNG